MSDNFLDSAWYFFRYPSANREDVAFDAAMTRKWLPVDMYVGGNEHAVLHMMYTRFLTMAFKDLGLADFDEPFSKFRANGMITRNGAKMSKSKGNTVDPNLFLDRYGADTFRTYLMFAVNFQEGGDFRDEGITGVQRFVERLWRYVTETGFAAGRIEEREVEALLHRQIRKVTRDLEELHYNTAVPALMELLSGLQEGRRHYLQAARVLLQLAAPFAPFITQERWERLGEEGLVCDAPWPEYDEKLIRVDQVEWVVQVNGKVRDRLQLAAGRSRREVEEAAFECERVREWTAGKEVVRTVFVPDKLVNVVVR